MSEFQFLNIYSGTPPQGKAGSNSEPALWNVYLNKEENAYLIQKLDGNNKPTAEKYKISPTYFGINFRQVNNSELKHAVDKISVNLALTKKKTNLFWIPFSAAVPLSAPQCKNQKTGRKKQGNLPFKQEKKISKANAKKQTAPLPAMCLTKE